MDGSTLPGSLLATRGAGICFVEVRVLVCFFLRGLEVLLVIRVFGWFEGLVVLKLRCIHWGLGSRVFRAIF